VELTVALVERRAFYNDLLPPSSPERQCHSFSDHFGCTNPFMESCNQLPFIVRLLDAHPTCKAVFVHILLEVEMNANLEASLASLLAF